VLLPVGISIYTFEAINNTMLGLLEFPAGIPVCLPRGLFFRGHPERFQGVVPLQPGGNGLRGVLPVLFTDAESLPLHDRLDDDAAAVRQVCRVVEEDLAVLHRTRNRVHGAPPS
jgi:hypothetical protein